MNTQIVKGGPALDLIMSPSTATGLNLVNGQWCAATLTGNNATLWEGPAGPPDTDLPVPAVGGSSTAGSGTLSQPTAGNYTVQYTQQVGGQLTNTEYNSKLFMMVGGQLLESQMFDLVDVATVPTAPFNLTVRVVY